MARRLPVLFTAALLLASCNVLLDVDKDFSVGDPQLAASGTTTVASSSGSAGAGATTSSSSGTGGMAGSSSSAGGASTGGGGSGAGASGSGGGGATGPCPASEPNGSCTTPVTACEYPGPVQCECWDAMWSCNACPANEPTNDNNCTGTNSGGDRCFYGLTHCRCTNMGTWRCRDCPASEPADGSACMGGIHCAYDGVGCACMNGMWSCN
jgi:hypothetical protein